MSQNSSTRTKDSVQVQPMYPVSSFAGFASRGESNHLFAVYTVDGVQTTVYVSGLKLDEFQADEALQALPKEERNLLVLSKCRHYANPNGSDYQLWYDSSEVEMV